MYGRREEWAICLRNDVLTRGHNTNNFVESAVKVVKEKVLHRLKAFNVTQLVDFVITRMERYYVRRLTDVANDRKPRRRRAKPFLRGNDVDCERIAQVWSTYLCIVNRNKITLL